MLPRLFQVLMIGAVLCFSTAVRAAITEVDHFDGAALDSNWIVSEVNWRTNPAVNGIGEWDASSNAGELTGFSSAAAKTDYLEAFVLRKDQGVAIGQSLQAKFRLIDPAGQAAVDNRNNSFLGIAISYTDNALAEFGASRYGLSTVILTVDARAPRIYATVSKQSGGQMSGAELHLNPTDLISYDDIIAGIHLAIYRESATVLKFYVAKPGEPYALAGQLTIDPAQLHADFGNAIGARAEWTADFANSGVQAIYDDILVVDGEPTVTLVPVEMSSFLVE